ncbi:hypothetical protein Tco_0471395 [Tanacetum coccineum]
MPPCEGQGGFFDSSSLSPDARTSARAGYRSRRMLVMQESEDFYTQLHDVRTDRKDIRLEINVVRGQRTAYETELHEIHISRIEWQRQRAEDDAVRQMMRTHVLEARAQIDTVEDTDISC